MIPFQLPLGPLGWRLRDIAAPEAALSKISAAIQWIRENSKPFREKDCAELAALIVSASHPHFKAVTSLHSIQSQKQFRYLHTLTLLLASEGTATSVAFDVGYESPNQFSRE